MSTSYTYDDALQIARDAEAQGYALLILNIGPGNANVLASRRAQFRIIDLCNPQNSKIQYPGVRFANEPAWVNAGTITLGALFAEMRRQDDIWGPDAADIMSYELRHKPRVPLKMEAVRLSYTSPNDKAPPAGSMLAVSKFTGDRLFRLADIVFADETVKSLEKQFRMAMVREYFEAGEKGPVPIGVRFSRAFTPRQESLKGMVHKTVVADIKGGSVPAPAPALSYTEHHLALVAAEPGSKIKIVP